MKPTKYTIRERGTHLSFFDFSTFPPNWPPSWKPLGVLLAGPGEFQFSQVTTTDVTKG